MKKIALVFLLLIGTTFTPPAYSGDIFAGLRWMTDGSRYRCTFSYQRLSLISGIIKTKRPTIQFYAWNNKCDEGIKRLTQRTRRWLDKSPYYLLVKITEPLKCKKRGKLAVSWSDYEACEIDRDTGSTYMDSFEEKLKEKHPMQVYL